MQKRNFVTRTIRNGTVKIDGKIFAPNSRWVEYDGRLDNLRPTFGLYWTGDKLEDYISLWGTEGKFNVEFETDEEYRKWLGSGEKDAPDLVDGCYPWTFWYVKEK